ncbi:MAG: exodeoxyribonuclease VII small subunit [Deltaproteobacteria bacterium]|nr:exodeoxyribonuclease VII small subunit [Deltaproteobacteria bacterium]MCX7953539.1 exodeoxyribonuclease VII small subunit [Deltaproteobacteria bacterium]
MQDLLEEVIKNPSKIKELQFETGIALFETIISKLSEKDIELSRLVKLYEIGTELSEFLFSQLKEAEEHIKVFRERGEKLVEEIHKTEELIQQLKNSSAR